MKNMIINNEKGFAGNILISVAAIIIAVIATSSFVLLTNNDTYNVTLMQDKIQQDLFMRSEVKRLNVVLNNQFDNVLPGRTIEMNEEDRLCTYIVVAKKSNSVTSVSSLGLPKEVNVAQSMITQKRGSLMSSREYSPVTRYIEKLSKREGLEQFLYMTDSEKSDISDGEDAAARVKFWGEDWLKHRVHSNGDIWIQNAGTVPAGNPNYQSWPCFSGKVTTAGRIRVYPGGELAVTSAPMDRIFLGGFEELVPKKEFLADARTIRAKGISPYGLTTRNDYIYMCKILDDIVSVKRLQLTTKIDTFVVYKRYPDQYHPVVFGNEDTYIDFNNPLYTNSIPMTDTLWSIPENQFTLNNQSMFLPGVTWVEGRVQGKMTIGCALNAYTTGDIYYKYTEKGQRPDTLNINRTDYFGLVSEKSILVKYKHRVKEGNRYITYFNNSVGPSGNVYLYGAFAAIGQRDNNLGADYAYKGEGVFTFEYQHPHGAVMPFRGKSQFTNQDTLYAFIDLHRHRFPPAPSTIAGRPTWHYWPNATPTSTDKPSNVGFPNPGAHQNPNFYPNYLSTTSRAVLYNTSDYPWINPVWPEAARFTGAGDEAAPINPLTDITWRRGTLNVFGSIAQRRRGFIRRSGNYSADNPDTGDWDPANYKFGPCHWPTGYAKLYSYDKRFYGVNPPDFPEVYEGSSAGSLSTAFENTSWNFKVPPRHF